MEQASLPKLKFQLMMEEFMAAREWTDDLEVDTEEGTVSLGTRINIGEFTGRLFIETYDEQAIVDVFFYYDFKCKQGKVDQLCRLLNDIHLRWAFGRFEVSTDGYIRWRHRVDFEGSQPSGISIERIVQPGWDGLERFADVISAVALTKQTAVEAIADFDNSLAGGEPVKPE